MSRYYEYIEQLWLEAQDYDESEWTQVFTPDEIQAINAYVECSHGNLLFDVQHHPELYE